MVTMSAHRMLLATLSCLLAGGMAACGSSGASSSGGSPSSAGSSPGTAAPSSIPSFSGTAGGGSAAAKEIAANWTAFFNAKTPAAKRISLLQDGQQFASIIKSQASGGLAASATAKVTKVTVTSAKQAQVVYSILVAGTPALSNKSGVAVNQGGVWKVGLASFCGLLALENLGGSSKLPAACNSAG
jgi:hypothetical protein